MAVGASLSVEVKQAQKRLREFGRKMEPGPILQGIGQRHLNWINQNFRVGGAETKWAPLSLNTIAARRGGGGSAQPLRDTGRLAQSFTSNVSRDQVEVGTEDQKAEFHQKGTKPYTIRPKSGRFLRFVTAPSGIAFAREVSHPGIPKRPLVPSERLGEELAVRVVRALVEKAAREASR